MYNKFRKLILKKESKEIEINNKFNKPIISRINNIKIIKWDIHIKISIIIRDNIINYKIIIMINIIIIINIEETNKIIEWNKNIMVIKWEDKNKEEEGCINNQNMD